MPARILEIGHELTSSGWLNSCYSGQKCCWTCQVRRIFYTLLPNGTYKLKMNKGEWLNILFHIITHNSTQNQLEELKTTNNFPFPSAFRVMSFIFLYLRCLEIIWLSDEFNSLPVSYSTEFYTISHILTLMMQLRWETQTNNPNCLWQTFAAWR